MYRRWNGHWLAHLLHLGTHMDGRGERDGLRVSKASVHDGGKTTTIDTNERKTVRGGGRAQTNTHTGGSSLVEHRAASTDAHWHRSGCSLGVEQTLRGGRVAQRQSRARKAVLLVGDGQEDTSRFEQLQAGSRERVSLMRRFRRRLRW